MRHLLIVLAFVLLALCLSLSLAANGFLVWGWRLADEKITVWQGQAEAAQATAQAGSAALTNLQAQVDQQRQELDHLRRQLQTLTPGPPPGEAPTPSVTPTPSPPSATAAPAVAPTPDLAAMDAIQRQVSALRELEPKRPVSRTVLSEVELRTYLTQKLAKDYPAEEAHDDALTLAAFDLLDPNTDLRQLEVDLYGEQVAGFYDPEAGQLDVIGDPAQFGPLEKTTFAHEYDHALQDQYFGLEKLGLDDKHDSQRSEAVRALAEGDATLLMQQYMQQYLTQQELLDLLKQVSQFDQTQFGQAPRVFREELEFPYTYGLAFVQSFYAEGGWPAVNRAWAQPPVSTEQILHPDRYRAGDAPAPVALPALTTTLGSGWHLLDEDVLGELLLRVILEGQLSSDEADKAAEGWGGDRYAVYYNDGLSQTVMALRTVWDTNSDAAEFVDAYARYAEARFGGPASEQRSGHRCWTRSQDSLCLYSQPGQALVILGPSLPVVNTVSAEFPQFR